MNLPVEAITEFREIYQRKLGKVLTTKEAGMKAENFLKLMVFLSEQPITKETIIYRNLK